MNTGGIGGGRVVFTGYKRSTNGSWLGYAELSTRRRSRCRQWQVEGKRCRHWKGEYAMGAKGLQILALQQPF